jgi:hypothetical protein
MLQQAPSADIRADNWHQTLLEMKQELDAKWGTLLQEETKEQYVTRESAIQLLSEIFLLVAKRLKHEDLKEIMLASGHSLEFATLAIAVLDAFDEIERRQANFDAEISQTKAKITQIESYIAKTK